ncbi:hypothetical protein FO519_002275 [Halicephalobus sp. NKZ332]|nr:hypothetical protein FO519_002275 [Halicephalobus sp. NKZ332]
MGSVNSARKSVLLPHPVVETEYGFIEGKKMLLPDGKVANVFLGVPFAKPPVGDLRFRKPEKPDPWSTPRKCNKYSNLSIQKTFVVYAVTGKYSEDCLHLNIVAPDWSPPEDSKGFPVMLYIHGGGFMIDSGVRYNYRKVGRTLVRHGVIVVITSYRLGLLGFFCTNDDTSVGNYGIWDQVFALKFVYENISKFGGDPGNITVFGQSAGGISSDLLSILPISKHMVNKVGVLGGNCETAWGVYTRYSMAKHCQMLAKKLGFRRSSTGRFTQEENLKMLLYFKSLPSSSFEMPILGARFVYKNLKLEVGPIVDGDLIPAPPYILRKIAPPKPVMAGVTLHEGLVFLAARDKFTSKSVYLDLQQKFIVMDKIVTAVYGPEAGLSINEVRKSYGITDLSIKDKKFLNKTIVQILDDNINKYALYNYCQSERSLGSTVWMYVFEHHNPGIISHFSLLIPFNAASHGTEIFYLMGHNMYFKSVRETREDKIVTELFTKMYTNFAKYGNPNGVPSNSRDSVPGDVVWEPVTEDYPERHMRILEKPILVDEFETRRLEKFSEFYSKFCHYSCDPEIFENGKYENKE